MKHNRRLLLAWIIAIGLVGLGLLADWYLIFNCPTDLFKRVWDTQSVAIKETINPYQQLYDDLLYPSVRITTADSIGSGVIIDSYNVITLQRSNVETLKQCNNEIFILTAGHVVGDEALVNVELFGSTESLPAFVVATDTDKDLALLRLVLSNNQQLITKIYSAKLASRDYVPYIFTPIWVIGCSLGYAQRPTEGCITAINEIASTTPRNDSVVNYWEMNAPIWPGNSGGGVFLKDTHELIGIAVWVKICQGQLASTMGGIVPLQTIYEFLTCVGNEFTASGKRFALTDNLSPETEQPTPQDLEMGGD
jgi:S1-C subfamily serine protease